MAKPNFKDLLLAKGEKIGLIAGGVIAGLIAVLGVMSIADASSPTDKVKKFDSEASRIDSGVRAQGEGVRDGMARHRALANRPQARHRCRCRQGVRPLRTTCPRRDSNPHVR